MGYTLIDSDTASGSAAINYTIDGTYDEILFTFTNYKPSADEKLLLWQVTTTGGANDRPIQSAAWRTTTRADGGTVSTEYAGGNDRAVGDDPNYQSLSMSADSARARMGCSGQLTIYKPADTTYYKQWIAECSMQEAAADSDAQTYDFGFRASGYIKDTAAVTGIQFASGLFNGSVSGTIAVGDFAFYGLA